MKLKLTGQLHRGQTIIEIIIATAIVASVMVAIMVGLTLSLKNTAQAKYQALASKLAQEGMEAFRRERDLLGFETWRSSLASQTYCLATIPAQTTPFTAGLCLDEDGLTMSGVTFFREADVEVGATDDDPVRVEVRVYWLDGTRRREAFLTQEFKRW